MSVSVSDAVRETAKELVRQVQAGNVSTTALAMHVLKLERATAVSVLRSNAGHSNHRHAHNNNNNKTGTSATVDNGSGVDSTSGIISAGTAAGLAATGIMGAMRAVREVELFLERHLEATHVVEAVSARVMDALESKRDERPSPYVPAAVTAAVAASAAAAAAAAAAVHATDNSSSMSTVTGTTVDDDSSTETADATGTGTDSGTAADSDTTTTETESGTETTRDAEKNATKTADGSNETVNGDNATAVCNQLASAAAAVASESRANFNAMLAHRVEVCLDELVERLADSHVDLVDQMATCFGPGDHVMVVPPPVFPTAAASFGAADAGGDGDKAKHKGKGKSQSQSKQQKSSSRGDDDDSDNNSNAGETTVIEAALVQAMDRITDNNAQQHASAATSSPDQPDGAHSNSDNTGSLCVSVVELQPDDNGAAAALAARLRRAGLRVRVTQDRHVTRDMQVMRNAFGGVTKVVLSAEAMDLEHGLACTTGSAMLCSMANRLRVAVVAVVSKFAMLPVGGSGGGGVNGGGGRANGGGMNGYGNNSGSANGNGGFGGYAGSNVAAVAATGRLCKFPGRVWDYDQACDDRGRDGIAVCAPKFDVVALAKVDVVMTEAGGYDPDYMVNLVPAFEKTSMAMEMVMAISVSMSMSMSGGKHSSSGDSGDRGQELGEDEEEDEKEQQQEQEQAQAHEGQQEQERGKEEVAED